MKEENEYQNAPEDVKTALDSAAIVSDFLPPPEMLIPKEETKKVTISLSKKSVDFFKDVAQETNIPYQQLIRKVLDTYTDHYV